MAALQRKHHRGLVIDGIGPAEATFRDGTRLQTGRDRRSSVFQRGSLFCPASSKELPQRFVSTLVSYPAGVDLCGQAAPLQLFEPRQAERMLIMAPRY